MLKIGQKVKFSDYIPKNMVSNSKFRKSLDGKVVTRGEGFRFRSTVFKNGVLEYSTNVMSGDPVEGTYLGSFRKKLKRVYLVPEITFAEPDTGGPFDFIRSRRPRAQLVRPDRVSTNNPRRQDDPYTLDTMAMVKIGRKVVGVPMENLLEHTYGRKSEVI
jgi:hypothetical protein